MHPLLTTKKWMAQLGVKNTMFQAIKLIKLHLEN